jgi:hypothetical protein
MPVTIIATPGDVNANSYVTLEEATAYFAERLYATAWTGAATDDVRRQALIMATQRLEPLPWDGYRASLNQRLQWPRSGCTDRDGYGVAFDAIPEDVRIACCEEAIGLLAKGSDPSAVDPLANFSALKVGSISIAMRETAPRTGDERRSIVWQRLEPYLESSSSFDRG